MHMETPKNTNQGKRAKIRNRYNQAPHLAQDTNTKVTTTQLSITNESQEVSQNKVGDNKASLNRRSRKHNINKTEITNDPQTKHRLGTVSKNILLDALNQFHSVQTSSLVQKWIKTYRCLVCFKDP